MGPRNDVPGASVRGSLGRQPRWAAPRDSPGGLLGAGLPVPGLAWERASAPGSRPPLRASQPAAAGPRTVRQGARTQGAGLPVARGKVELGEVGSDGGAPQGGHGGVVGSARGLQRRGRDPETPAARSPEEAGKRRGGGGGGPGPRREEGRGKERGELGTRSWEGVEVQERAETGARGSEVLGRRMGRREE